MDEDNQYIDAVDSYNTLKKFLINNESNIRKFKKYWSLTDIKEEDEKLILNNKDMPFDEICKLYKEKHKALSIEDMYLEEFSKEINRLYKEYGTSMVWKIEDNGNIKDRHGNRFRGSEFIILMIDSIYDYLKDKCR